MSGSDSGLAESMIPIFARRKSDTVQETSAGITRHTPGFEPVPHEH